MEKKLHVVLVLGGCAAVAGAALAVATPWGLGISPDSAVYIGAARSLARGHGFTLPADSGTFAPIVHYAPLYPALLALFSLDGPDAIAVAKWINVLLFFANVFFAGAVVYSIIETVGSWFSAFWLSSREIQLLSLCVAAFAGLLIWLLSRTMVARAESAFAEQLKIVLFLTTFVVANYLLLLFVSISLLDVQTPLDSRILSASYIPSVLFVVLGVTFLTQRKQKSVGSRLIVPVLALSAMGMQLPATLNWLRQLHWEGVGYSSRLWKESETIKRLATLSASHSIYSNAPDVVYTLLGSPAAMIPRKTNTDSNLPNPDYRVQIEQMKRELQTTNGVLIFFDRVNWRSYLPSTEELESILGLRLMLKTADGSVYQAR